MKQCISGFEEELLTSYIPYHLQWFANDGEGGEKTEPATQKKLDDARKDGKVAKSKELTQAFDLIVLFLCIKIFGGMVGERFLGVFQLIYGNISDIVVTYRQGFTAAATMSLMVTVMKEMAIMVLPFFAFGFAITFLVSLVQVGWKVTAKPMQPKLSKFNPINGFKRIFSKDSLFELLKAIVKIGVIAYISYTSIKNEADTLFLLYDLTIQQAIGLVAEIIIDVGIKVSIVYLIVAVADWAYQKHKFKEDMKMTKQEVKDEYKNMEGDPQIKGRQRSKMREVSQKRMMQDVPKADVVITNPTHFAVALSYDAEAAKAPVVVAKGEDYLAQKIKEVARENNVSIVENKPLARMLYHNVDIGAEIPPELYQAVAEVLAEVYKK